MGMDYVTLELHSYMACLLMMEKYTVFRKSFFFWWVYPSSFGQIEGVPSDLIEMRSRLLGFYTQEAPRDPGRRDCQVPQPMWHERRQFLQEELHELRGDRCRSSKNSRDCYSVTAMTGYCWTFVESMMQKPLKIKMILLQHWKGLRWQKGHWVQDILFQQITILSRIICGKNFRRLFEKEKAVSPGVSLFTHLFAGGNVIGWKFRQIAGDDIGMLNK